MASQVSQQTTRKTKQACGNGILVDTTRRSTDDSRKYSVSKPNIDKVIGLNAGYKDNDDNLLAKNPPVGHDALKKTVHATHAVGALLTLNGTVPICGHAVVVLEAALELANVTLAVGPHHATLPSDVNVKGALVHHAVAELQLALAVALVALERAHVDGAVGKTLDAVAVAHAVEPVAVEHVAVGVEHHALAVAQAALEDALELVAVDVDDLAGALVDIGSKGPEVARAVNGKVLALAVPLPPAPLAGVDRPVGENDRAPLDQPVANIDGNSVVKVGRPAA
ncbi:AsmA family protein [Babesia caballi]|uniref:AsmA family protein n=1 Tax=Babesia caballi TaxID=5871 RepID=A0AAV4LYI8_BABCB|nr:AsmA family protein [Babesia caballi]